MKEFYAALAAVLVAALPIIRSYALSHLTPERLASVSDIADGAVRAAETIAANFKGTNPAEWTAFETWGEAKAAYASEVVAKGAKRFGFKLTPAEVTTFVHAALARMESPADGTVAS